MKRIIKLNPNINTLLFDLDDTLYPRGSGLMKKIGEQIRAYSMYKFGLNVEQADALRLNYKEKYGSSLVGYVHIEKVDPEEYREFVYNIDYSQYIKPDKCVAAMFAELDYRKIIYTNGARCHAFSVLAALGVDFKLVDQVVAIEDAGFYAKPMPESYSAMIKLTGITPEESAFLDDQERNLLAAKVFGIGGTVLVGGESDKVSFCIDNICELIF